MDPDTLALLEDKVQRAVETVTVLRKERDAARQASAGLETLQSRVSDLTRELDALRADHDAAKAERDTLKAEREAVKERLQKLLTHIDRLNSDT
ncbi:MAG: cell division protein ZapB [Bryobacteraceae bacterium]